MIHTLFDPWDSTSCFPRSPGQRYRGFPIRSRLPVTACSSSCDIAPNCFPGSILLACRMTPSDNKCCCRSRLRRFSVSGLGGAKGQRAYQRLSRTRLLRRASRGLGLTAIPRSPASGLLSASSDGRPALGSRSRLHFRLSQASRQTSEGHRQIPRWRQG